MVSKLMNKIDISIIIPLYKGKKYCDRLVKLIERNCSFNNLNEKCSVEVIFVNDYPQESISLDTRNSLFEIHLFAHKENHGIHAARVTGINNAKGNYIILLDQDDLVEENWIYSQWNKIEENKMSVCICNGWRERFRVLGEIKTLKCKVKSVEYFLTSGNPIMSPGQVIMRKDCIPQEWLKNILRNNGADDLLLWIMMLKKGCRFGVNDAYLYYHTPARSKDSVDDLQMVQSLKESLKILMNTEILNRDECETFAHGIALVEVAGIFGSWDDMHILQIIKQQRKFSKLFYTLRTWLDLKNKGKCIEHFFSAHCYNKIAIYGMGYIGESLYYELDNDNGNICVEYAIDRSAIDFERKLEILRPEDELAEVDLIVITLVENYDDVYEMLIQKVMCPVITIQQLLLELANE